MIRKSIYLKSMYILLLALLISAPLGTQAIGLVTKPIEIKDALKGKTYQDEMIIVNSDKTIERLEFVATGQIATWTKFYGLNDKINATTTGEITPQGRLNMIVQFTVPSSTPNGTYQGSVSVIKKAGSKTTKDESVASMEQKIDREVSITVKGVETIKFNVSVIPASYAPKPNEPLSIRFIYDNQGNVSIQPQIQIKIMQDTTIFHNAIYPFPEELSAVLPGSIEEISKIEIPTNNLQPGKYLVELNFLVNGESAVQKYFHFILGAPQIYGAWYQPFMRWEFLLALGLLALFVSFMNIYVARKKARINKKISRSTSQFYQNNLKKPKKEKIIIEDIE